MSDELAIPGTRILNGFFGTGEVAGLSENKVYIQFDIKRKASFTDLRIAFRKEFAFTDVEQKPAESQYTEVPLEITDDRNIHKLWEYIDDNSGISNNSTGNSESFIKNELDWICNLRSTKPILHPWRYRKSDQLLCELVNRTVYYYSSHYKIALRTEYSYADKKFRLRRITPGLGKELEGFCIMGTPLYGISNSSKSDGFWVIKHHGAPITVFDPFFSYSKYILKPNKPFQFKILAIAFGCSYSDSSSLIETYLEKENHEINTYSFLGKVNEVKNYSSSNIAEKRYCHSFLEIKNTGYGAQHFIEIMLPVFFDKRCPRKGDWVKGKLFFIGFPSQAVDWYDGCVVLPRQFNKFPKYKLWRSYCKGLAQQAVSMCDHLAELCYQNDINGCRINILEKYYTPDHFNYSHNDRNLNIIQYLFRSLINNLKNEPLELELAEVVLKFDFKNHNRETSCVAIATALIKDVNGKEITSTHKHDLILKEHPETKNVRDKF